MSVSSNDIDGNAVPAGFRSGFVAIIGRPNVGKSTLLNHLLGEKIAIVSPKPQTTRNRILAIKTLPQAQLVLLDTPGIHRARSLLNRRMVDTAKRSMQEVDVALWVLDARSGLRSEDEDIGGLLREWGGAILVALNKIDTVAKLKLLPIMERCAGILPRADIVPISARHGQNTTVLVDEVVKLLPSGPRYYPEDELTDQTERFIASEIIREKIFILIRQEVPYSTVVTVDNFEEKREGTLAVISATIHVERDTQKAILIGKQGAALKRIGEQARTELEELLGRDVYLDLVVTVTAAWSRNVRSLSEFGL